MRFLNRYHYAVTKQRIIISCYTIIFISFCVALLYSQKNSKRKAMLKNVNKRLAVLAYRILLITRPLVCILLFQLLTQYLSTKWDKLASLDKPNFTLICWYLVTYFNSFTNAVAFEATFNR